MAIFAYEPIGFDGELITVEVDIRRGIPSVDIVGLPDGAVREARDRIRAAIRNGGFTFPLDRLLISLAPAGIRKAGAAFDLAMAMAVLQTSGQMPDLGRSAMVLGELELSGRVRPVSGVMAAVAAGQSAGITCFVVPRANLAESMVLASEQSWAVDSIDSVARLAAAIRGAGPVAEFRTQREGVSDQQLGRTQREGVSDQQLGRTQREGVSDQQLGRVRREGVSDQQLGRTQREGVSDQQLGRVRPQPLDDMADIRGQAVLRRALEIVAAGDHHLLMFGSPGSGKTMAARRLPGLLPDLSPEDAVAVTKLHSLAACLPEATALVCRPPFRAPHHGASAEGIIGGGRSRKPGEISLAHAGVLFMDETPEFRCDVLQSLREPLESGYISIARADRIIRYPSRFMLVMACNPCPCGNLGRSQAVCLCSMDEIRRYWKRLGAPLLDRIDIRIPVQPATAAEMVGPRGEDSASVRARVAAARARQASRYRRLGCLTNGRVPPEAEDCFFHLSGTPKTRFVSMASEAGLSSRACHSVLKVARTIADLAGAQSVHEDHLAEAVSLRRYGEQDMFWMVP
jgi:magnesium chelatase family protein